MAHTREFRQEGVRRVTAAGYHAWEKRPVCGRSQEDERLKKLIQTTHNRSHGIYGAPRIPA